MYAVTSIPLERRTRAYLRSAEFGFFGVIVPTRVQTPRFCGEFWEISSLRKLLYPYCRAGAADLDCLRFRPFRISWLIVGKYATSSPSNSRPQNQAVHLWTKEGHRPFAHNRYASRKSGMHLPHHPMAPDRNKRAGSLLLQDRRRGGTHFASTGLPQLLHGIDVGDGDSPVPAHGDDRRDHVLVCILRNDDFLHLPLFNCFFRLLGTDQ